MRRCANGELTRTDDGHWQDPDERKRLLYSVARWSGVAIQDAHFARVLEDIMDPEALERQRIRRHIYLARYGRQSMIQWEDVDSRVVRRYMEALSEFIAEENEAMKRANKQSEE